MAPEREHCQMQVWLVWIPVHCKKQVHCQKLVSLWGLRCRHWLLFQFRFHDLLLVPLPLAQLQ